MGKTFANVRVGYYLKLVRPTWDSNYFENVKEYIAQVTNIEIHGDELIISYKTPQFGHTIRVHKNQSNKHAWIHERKWKNLGYYWRNKNKEYPSTREYRITDKYKYVYKIELL